MHEVSAGSRQKRRSMLVYGGAGRYGSDSRQAVDVAAGMTFKRVSNPYVNYIV